MELKLRLEFSNFKFTSKRIFTNYNAYQNSISTVILRIYLVKYLKFEIPTEITKKKPWQPILLYDYWGLSDEGFLKVTYTS